MEYKALSRDLMRQLGFHDKMLDSTKGKAKVRQELSTVVLGVMVVGMVALVGSAGAAYGDGSAMAYHAALATWLAIACGAAGIAWVIMSLLFSMDAQSGPDIEQPIAFAEFGRDGTVDTGKLDDWPMMEEEEFYRQLAESCIVALRSRESEAARIRAATSRSQAALFVGLAVVGIGAAAALVLLGVSWA